jgi:CheY-like chemotaxis protein
MVVLRGFVRQRQNLIALEGVLGDLGHNLIMADSGHEALRQMLARDIALVLLDVRMPGLDGFETCRRLREDGVVMASGEVLRRTG